MRKLLASAASALALLAAAPALATVTSPTAAQTDSANGSTTAFAYNFLIPYQASSTTPAVTVIVYNSSTGTTSTLASNQYSITGVGSASGGTVTYPLTGSPLPSGSSVTIARSYAYTQQTAVGNVGFYPHVTEQVADSLEYQIQQLQNTTLTSLPNTWPQLQTFSNGINVSGTAALSGLTASGSSTLHGLTATTLGVSGASTLASTTASSLSVTGNAVLAGVSNFTSQAGLVGPGANLRLSYNQNGNDAYIYQSGSNFLALGWGTYQNSSGSSIAANTAGSVFEVAQSGLYYYTFTGATVGQTLTAGSFTNLLNFTPSGFNLSAPLAVTGPASVSGALTLGNVTGTQQCLQVNSAGVVSGTGGVCGGSPLGVANTWTAMQTFAGTTQAIAVGAPGWLTPIIPFTETTTATDSLSGSGGIGALGACRTSDSTNAGAMGCQGVSGISINNNVTQIQYGYGGYFEGRRSANAGVEEAIEATVVNQGNTVTTHPYLFGASGMTASLWTGCGRTDVSPSNNCSLAYGITNNGAAYNEGIVFTNNSLVNQGGGISYAIDMPQGYQIQWRESADGGIASVIRSDTASSGTGNTAGINFFNGGIYFQVPIGGTNIGALTASGFAVTGALSATGKVSSSAFITAPGEIATGSSPTTTGSTCTPITGFVGGNTAGKFVTTCSTGQTVTLNFSVTAPNGWTCHFEDANSSTFVWYQTGYTTTSCTVTANSAVTAHNVGFMAQGF